MKTLRYRVAGEPVRVNVVESERDLEGFADFVRANRYLAYDTEGTGLNYWSDGWRLRLVQFGTATEAWVLPIEKGEIYAEYARRTLVWADQITCHNATFDLLIADKHLGVNADRMYLKTLDTRILSHLVDPRGKHEGGTGHALKDLSAVYVDTKAPDTQGDLTKVFQELKLTKVTGWADIPLDHETYLLYAGLDVILTARLERQLLKRVPTSAVGLIGEEHEIARICAGMEKTGFLVDADYALGLSDYLTAEEAFWQEKALVLGVENVNSTDEIADAFYAKGIDIPESTASGKPKVDKKFLEAMAGQGSNLAEAVIKAKRAGKWRKTWVDKFLAEMDGQNRVHPKINPLQARTARMSITGVPAQTLPATDSLIRSCFVAEFGHLIGSIDYQAQELRVLAALSGDHIMQKAFRDGLDLHQITADAAGVSRKVGKQANFLRVYGGGAKTLASQAGIDIGVAQRVIKGMDSTYPRVAEYSDELKEQALEAGHIVTWTGRVLPVDRNRIYSALNYAVQSGARDITCKGLIEIDRKGLSEFLRLPVHDEVVGSFPAKSAEYLAGVIGECMTMTLRGVELPTDPAIGGRSWGSLYEME